VYALGTGVGHSGKHPLSDDRSLKLCHCPNNMEKHLSGRTGSVDLLMEAYELDSQRVEFGQGVNELFQGTGETIKAVNHHGITLPAPYERHHAIKFWPAHLRTAHDVRKLFTRPAAALGEFLHLAELHSRVLAFVGGANPGVEEGDHL